MSAVATTDAPMTATDAMVVEFEFDSNTPGTAKFNEVVPDGAPPKIGRLYLKKWTHHNLGTPARLTVTVKAHK